LSFFKKTRVFLNPATVVRKKAAALFWTVASGVSRWQFFHR